VIVANQWGTASQNEATQAKLEGSLVKWEAVMVKQGASLDGRLAKLEAMVVFVTCNELITKVDSGLGDLKFELVEVLKRLDANRL
jgi:hypothetical protein